VSPAVLSVPSKVFLLGEYAVLAGRPAIVAAFAPRFCLATRFFEGSRELVLHPASPAARMGDESHWYWSDPWNGAGGFGASSAQALLLSMCHSIRGGEGLQSAWRRYRGAALASGGVTPSGADFVTQAMGGVIDFRILPGETDRFEARQVGHIASTLHLRVLQASQQSGRKVATHDHLASLSGVERVSSALQPVLDRGLQSFHSADSAGFARAMNDFADRLASLDLEDGATRRDREALGKIPGVLGIKGSGAMQADALVALIDARSLDPDAWRSELSRLNLRDLGQITGQEPGLSGDP
jgi:mevalonate kinase